jgi:hypothetical protein
LRQFLTIRHSVPWFFSGLGLPQVLCSTALRYVFVIIQCIGGRHLKNTPYIDWYESTYPQRGS